ncbi:hypothetical protein HYT26_04360 [Candidatus Pacearchaeota archaeon]|nr:hypothetical protein [Candidatus Pacearchaeota archaeon]
MDIHFLKLAIEEARKSLSQDGYNVGAVIIKEGRIISKAFSGEDSEECHAEELAIKKCHENISGATIYVTMEPCDFRRSGKKSCCDQIIESGIHRIVYGVLDPDTFVPCHGIEKLKEAELELFHLKSLEKECKELTPSLPFYKVGFE